MQAKELSDLCTGIFFLCCKYLLLSACLFINGVLNILLNIARIHTEGGYIIQYNVNVLHELCDQHPDRDWHHQHPKAPFMPPLATMLQGHHCPDFHMHGR